MRIVLVAQEAAGVQALRLLVEAGHDVDMVLTQDRTPTLPVATVARMARDQGLPIHDAALVGEATFARSLRARSVDILLNVYSMKVVHPAVLAAPRIGSFNLHPGPLPRYAGLNAPSWAIFRGETVHGVTVHWMDPGLDSGAICYQEAVPILSDDTGLTLSARCVRTGLPLLSRLLETAAADPARIPAVPQDMRRREYFGWEVPHGGRLDWSWPAASVDRLVRAASFHPLASPWGVPRAVIGDAEVGILATEMVDGPSGTTPGSVRRTEQGQVQVACADGWLTIRLISVEGKPLDPAMALGMFDRSARDSRGR